MKTRKIMLACLIAVLLLTLQIAVHAQNQGSGSNALLGSWKVRLTPGLGQPQFDELMTFSDGGGIVESNNYPFFQLGLTAGPGQGTWSYAGRQRFPFTFIKFLFTPQGQAAGTLKVTGTITYSPSDDTWSGPATVAICDNQANNCNTIDATNGHATRIVAGQ
jgi:hypothetical protein